MDPAPPEPRTHRYRPAAAIALAGLAVLLLALCAPRGGLAQAAHLAAEDSPQAGVRPGARFAGVVTHVADGDTLDVSSGGQTVTVRLDGVDAPEGGQPFSAEARGQLRVLAFSQRVTVLVKDTDRYGRLVARVVVGADERGQGGKDASEEMLRAGLAWHFTRYSSDRRLARLEAAARARRAGLWADPSAVPPWTWRSRERARTPGPSGQAATRGTRRAAPPPAPSPGASPPRAGAPDRAAAPGPAPGPYHAAPGPYHGNVSSGVYHARPCRDYDCRNCTRVFATRDEAESAGFRPHRECVFPAR